MKISYLFARPKKGDMVALPSSVGFPAGSVTDRIRGSKDRLLECGLPMSSGDCLLRPSSLTFIARRSPHSINCEKSSFSRGCRTVLHLDSFDLDP